jgi:hypothetical protein
MIIHCVPKTYGYTTSFKLRQLLGPRVPTQFDSRAWFGAVASLVSGHTVALVGPALAAHAPTYIGGVRPMLEVVPAGCRYGGLKRCRPFVVGLGQYPHLVRGQPKITKHLPKRLAGAQDQSRRRP